MSIDKRKFLVTIDCTIKYQAAVRIKTMNADELFEALDVILKMYNDARYSIKKCTVMRDNTYIADDSVMCY